MLLRLHAVAELDDTTDAARPVRERAASGDDDNAWLLSEWEAGRLVLARVTVQVTAVNGGGSEVTLSRVVDGVWLEPDELPGVEDQVAQVAPAEWPALADELRGRGIELGEQQLERSYLHVEIGERLRSALSAKAT